MLNCKEKTVCSSFFLCFDWPVANTQNVAFSVLISFPNERNAFFPISFFLLFYKHHKSNALLFPNYWWKKRHRLVDWIMNTFRFLFWTRRLFCHPNKQKKVLYSSLISFASLPTDAYDTLRIRKFRRWMIVKLANKRLISLSMPIRLSVSWMVGWSVGQSVCHNFLKKPGIYISMLPLENCLYLQY